MFADHIKDHETLFATWMSVKTALISSVLCFFVAIPTGYVLTHMPIPFRGGVEAILELTMTLPYIVIGLSLLILFSTPAGKALKAVAGWLGASRFQQFRTIILPLCKNTLISSFILIWSRALGEFGATLMLVGVTRMKTETLPGNIYLNVSTNQIDGALASAFLLLILAALSLFISHLVTRTDWRKQRYERND